MQPADARLVADLSAMLGPRQVLARPIDRLGRSGDASPYRLVPQVVVRPRDLDDVQALLAYTSRERRHLTFRTAGTSLSGQAISDDILVELAPYWNRHEVLDGGARIRSQPGVVGGLLNRVLAPHGYRIGPDPASIDACMIGGIVANNSSGMCCGISQNAYHTLDAMRFLLADGTLVDTGQPEADARLRDDRPELYAELLRLRDEVRLDAALSTRIRSKFSRKNTTAYSLNAFLDHDTAAQILAHLMVGSEGTLGFVAEVVLRTIPEPPQRATALLCFEDLGEASQAVAPLAELGAAAIEIMDATALRSIETELPRPFAVAARNAALLVEFREATAERLIRVTSAAREIAAGFRQLTPADFAAAPAERAELWRLRKGLFPTVGAMRPRGTAVLLEDVAVPVERLAEAISDLQELFGRHGFPETSIFGHAKDGNLHFAMTPDFADPAAVERYDVFMQDLATLIVGRYDGALKAEHGSGRNMAPFVRTEWGDRAYALMQTVKRLLDPEGILNPGVLLNDNPKLHVENLKPLPPVAEIVDRCIECGFCEPRCPSRFLTLSPRQRIVVRREIARLAGLGDSVSRDVQRSLEADFAYEGSSTCAGDSMCQTSCPVKIDTGALVKELKHDAHSAFARWLAGQAARHFASVAATVRIGLRLAGALRSVPGGARALHATTRLLHALAPDLVPVLDPQDSLPAAARPLSIRSPAPCAARTVVYFPTCLTRTLGPEPGETPSAELILAVLERAGFGVRWPAGLSGRCCGMPFSSRAYAEAAREAGQATIDALWSASDGGRHTVVTDASPCAATLRELAAEAQASGRRLEILDFPAFWAREGLPALGASVTRRPGTAVLHPTCSLTRSGGLDDLLAVANAHAQRVVVPAAAECCGFAGDRGFFVPELTQSATRAEASEVAALEDSGAAYYSTCATCEIGMSRAVGHRYQPLVRLVHDSLFGDR